ncbi:MFS transporter [Actinomadura barringtoniae]|uniref:MFS transporter n=1 Tax=Actinomadura barringtoniae TaxID=1427535 RepID=A0A939T2K0_9ACTN|nr:bifunctional serine/threonine protein kinase/MFS transporter [Actinomadura barringtoniae]MBO2446738.1 MFS transporter [Actinomadura barringtoniae]
MAGPLRPGDPERLGEYELAGRLGEGGQGVVFEGRGPEGERVAVKLLRAQFTSDASARARFVREIEAAERVAGFCTAQVLDADSEGDQPYIVSEFVPGRSLQELVREEGPRTGGELYRLAIGTATALAAIHEAGIVHRDFKPPNVLMGPDGPRVIDFGIAKALDATGTMTSHVVGTPAYMAPEQVAGAVVGPHTDIFAWAATVLYAATGRSPFGNDTIPAVMHRVLHADPDLSALPQQLAGLVAACLSKDPGRRPSAPQLLLHLLDHQGAAPAGAAAMLEQGASMATGKFAPVVAPGAAPVAPTLPGQAVPTLPPMVGPPPFLPPGPPLPAVPRGIAGGNAVLTLAAVTVAALAVGLGNSFTLNAMPVNAHTQLWFSLAYPLALVVTVVPFGRLADSIGRKKVFLAGLGVFAISLMLGGWFFLDFQDAAGAWLQLLPRALMGIGAAAVLAPSLALLQDMFPGRRLGIALGVWGAFLGVPQVAASVTARMVRDFGARWVLYFAAVPLVLLAAVLGAFGTRDSRREGRGRAADVAGTVLLSLFGAGVIFGVWCGGSYGWIDWRTLAGLVPAAAVLVALVTVALAVRPHLLPLRLVLSAVAAIAAFASLSVLDQAVFEWTFYGGYGQGSLLGLRLSPVLIGALVSAPVTGLLCWRLGPRWPMTAATALVAIATAALAFGQNGGSPYLVIAAWLFLYGLAWGALAVSVAMAILGDVPEGLAGFGSGLQEQIALLGTGLVSVFMAFRGDGDLIAPPSAARGYRPDYEAMLRTPLLLAAAVAVAAAVLAAFIRRPADR